MKKRNKRVEILLTEEEYDRISKIAKKLDMPIGRLIRNMTLVGLENAKLFNAIGLFDIAKLVEKIREKALGVKDINLDFSK